MLLEMLFFKPVLIVAYSFFSGFPDLHPWVTSLTPVYLLEGKTA